MKARMRRLHGCFNGAATVRSRIASAPTSLPPPGRCFNGAATVRSRIEGGLRAWSSSSDLLQWGRDR